MQTALNGATTMPYDLPTDLQAAAAAGFTAVEIWYPKLTRFLTDHPLTVVQSLLQEHQLSVVALCPLILDYGAAAASARAELGRAAEIAARLGCPTVVVCLRRPPATLPLAQARAWAVRELAWAVEQAAAWGITLALEPLGGHPLVPGPREALALLAEAGLPAAALVLDTFHLYKSGVSSADLAAVPLERIALLHVNDCEDRPRAELQDTHRLYPTLGVIPVDALLGSLLRRGYTGALSVEVFREEYWRQPALEIARQARLHLDRLLTRLKTAR